MKSEIEKAYVIMVNDYPEGVATSKDEAEKLKAKIQTEMDERFPYQKMFVRAYGPFVVNQHQRSSWSL